jgi:hypothetical protein
MASSTVLAALSVPLPYHYHCLVSSRGVFALVFVFRLNCQLEKSNITPVTLHPAFAGSIIIHHTQCDIAPDGTGAVLAVPCTTCMLAHSASGPEGR